jgi:hypothetical protein
MGVALIKAEETETPSTHQSRPRARSGPRRSPHRAPASELALLATPITTVFQSPEGHIHHAWCHQPLQYQGRRAALEVDFYCLRCIEHITLPESVLSRIPVRERVVKV